MLITELLKKDMKVEAKGIWMRNDLSGHYLGQDIKPLMVDIEYKKSEDSLVFEDKHQPLSPFPCYELPAELTAKVHFVTSEIEIPLMLKSMKD